MSKVQDCVLGAFLSAVVVMIIITAICLQRAATIKEMQVEAVKRGVAEYDVNGDWRWKPVKTEIEK